MPCGRGEAAKHPSHRKPLNSSSPLWGSLCTGTLKLQAPLPVSPEGAPFIPGRLLLYRFLPQLQADSPPCSHPLGPPLRSSCSVPRKWGACLPTPPLPPASPLKTPPSQVNRSSFWRNSPERARKVKTINAGHFTFFPCRTQLGRREGKSLRGVQSGKERSPGPQFKIFLWFLPQQRRIKKTTHKKRKFLCS